MAGESQQVPSSAPDPSVLTTEALQRGLDSERDYTDGQIALLLERLRGIDRATELLNESVNRFPTDVQKEVGHLKELLSNAITARDSMVALQTECSDKAINKSELAFAKQVDALAVLLQKNTDTLSDRINDIKTRVDRIEAQKLGGSEQRTGSMALIASVTGVIIFVVIVAGFVIALATKSPA